MIVFGSRKYLVDLGHQEAQQCTNCGQSRLFRTFLQYTSFALYWVFGVITERKYLKLCDVCSRGVEVPKDQLPSYNPTPASIPFMHRYGLLIFGGIVVGIVAFSALLGEG